jgi:hypothetical protein
MKKREIYVISVENNIDVNYTPRATESEEKAFEIKDEIVSELNSKLSELNSKLGSDCEFNVYENEYVYKKFTDDYSQCIEVYIECIPVE